MPTTEKGGAAISYSIIPADPNEHREEILALWKRNFEKVPEGRFEWIYQNNPYGRPTCFFLKHDPSGEIVGSYALFPRSLVINGKPCQGYICGDLIVDTSHRSLGPAMSLVRAAIAKCDADEDTVLFGFPNEFSAPVILMSGFKQLSERIKLTKVLRTHPYLRKRVKPDWLARVIAGPLDAWLSMRYGRDSWFSNRYSYEVATSFDARFDRLFEEISTTYALKGELSRRYMNWRFMDSPYEENKIFTMISRSDQSLCGYIVFNSTNQRVQVVDLGLTNPEQTLTRMLSAFHRYQKSQGMISIAFDYAGDEQLLSQLVKSGFSVRSRELKTIIYLSSKLKHLVKEIQLGHWYLTAGDNDV